MAAPRLDDLPAPPAGRSGWPWTEESERLAPAMPDGRPWPRITIVTPSYNQAEHLEETLRSVLLQGYPNLEYIVVDGGSTDGSVAILERYAPWLARWSSEPDRGQSHAINKGFDGATGEIFAWLNSDDTYYRGALKRVARTMGRSGCDIHLGAMDKVRKDGGELHFVKRSSPHEGDPIHSFPIYANGGRHDFHYIQPPMFWRRGIWEQTGGLDERFHYVMDIEWCSRATASGAAIETSEEVLARFVLHPESKSTQVHHRFPREKVRMYGQFTRSRGFRPLQCCLAALLPLQRALSHGAVHERQEGRVARAFAARVGAAAVRLLRGLPALRGRTEAAGPTSSTGELPRIGMDRAG